MIFENMSFADANRDLKWKDGINIGISAAVGTVSGTAKFAKLMSSNLGKKIMKEVMVSLVEGFIKVGVELLRENRDISEEDAEQIVIGTIASVVSKRFIPKFASKNLKQAEKQLKYYKNPKYAKAILAKQTRDAAKGLDDIGKVTTKVATKIIKKDVQKEYKKLTE